MLIRFGVSNWRSIKEYQELLLTESKFKVDNAEVDLIETTAVKEGLLPAAVIYGGNASGKSNVLDAFRFFRSGILRSSKLEDDDVGVNCHPFLLDKESRDLPSRMDCDFIIDEVRYHYGIEVTKSRIEEEWLYAYPSGQRQVWFHRNVNEENEYYFGRMLKGKNRIIADLTRKDSLFICHAAENNHKQLTDIYEYFKTKLKLLLSQEIVHAHEVEREFKDEKLKNQVMTFIRSVDAGIIDVIIKKDHETLERMKSDSDFKKTMKSLLKAKNIDEKDLDKIFNNIVKELSFSHETLDGSLEILPFSCESRGTKHLISLLIPIFKTINSGGVIFVDEIDTSLHPYLSLSLVKLFLFKNTNRNNAQLIFTTHDTTLLAGTNMRRDQIWFTEKVRGGMTKLYPLTDYKLRPTDNKEKAYLQGRVGGVPIIADIDSLAQALLGTENDF